ncbi:MAG: type II toxin-antitoxin system Phd/YefM family antitoxin [Acidobacteriota bacterium]|nr:type II toxin-antitoxin system Phd/YefM family antitoxin [Acidobacteriota bacterium]
MEEMAVSKFKATCLAVLDRVARTGEPVRITKHGKPIAEIVPPAPPKRKKNWLGAMANRTQILGDIVAPAFDPDEWHANQGRLL